MSPRPTPSTIASFQPPSRSAGRRTAAAAATIERERDAEDERGPERVGLPGGVHRREVEAEADRREQREPDAGGDPPLAALLVLLRGEHDADERAGDRRRTARAEGRSPVSDPEDDRHDRRGARDRRHDRHRADRHPAVVGVEPERPRDRGRDREQHRRVVASRGRAASDDASDRRDARRAAPRAARAAPRACVPATGRRSRRPPRRGSRRARAEARSPGRAGGGARVELVRVVEDGRLGGARPRARRGARRRSGAARPLPAASRPCGALLDQPHARGGRGRAAGPRRSARTPARA